MAILRIEGLFKEFSGLVVLSEINLQIEEGERFAVIGPNGAGKSTLFNLITGLHNATRGKVYFRGEDISRLPAHRIARLGVSRSFQVTNIFPKMTVYENIRNAIISKQDKRFYWGGLLNGKGGIDAETRRIMDLVELHEIGGSRAMELSYGKQRQLEIALAIARDPFLIMLDEPVAGLDADETSHTVTLIKRVSIGKTLIIVEHDMDVVFEVADRIAVLSQGRVLAVGSPKEIRENENVRKAYLGKE